MTKKTYYVVQLHKTRYSANTDARMGAWYIRDGGSEWDRNEDDYNNDGGGEHEHGTHSSAQFGR